jgi:hypothetical protein
VQLVTADRRVEHRRQLPLGPAPRQHSQVVDLLRIRGTLLTANLDDVSSTCTVAYPNFGVHEVNRRLINSSTGERNRKEKQQT